MSRIALPIYRYGVSLRLDTCVFHAFLRWYLLSNLWMIAVYIHPLLRTWCALMVDGLYSAVNQCIPAHRVSRWILGWIATVQVRACDEYWYVHVLLVSRCQLVNSLSFLFWSIDHSIVSCFAATRAIERDRSIKEQQSAFLGGDYKPPKPADVDDIWDWRSAAAVSALFYYTERMEGEMCKERTNAQRMRFFVWWLSLSFSAQHLCTCILKWCHKVHLCTETHVPRIALQYLLKLPYLIVTWHQLNIAIHCSLLQFFCICYIHQPNLQTHVHA